MQQPAGLNPEITPRLRPDSDPLLAVGPLAIVGGCGHVGLPLGLAFARKGYQVDLIDTSADRIALVNSGKMPFHEDDAEDLLARCVQSGAVKATADLTELEDASAIIVTIGTPVDEYLDPSVVAFDQSLEELVQRVRPGQLLILRSTLFPGVTARLGTQLEQMGRGDVDLAYCPERIVQGKSLVELEQLPQLIGGTTQRAADRAAALFRLICPQVIFLRPVEAELAKLFCNAWPYINFAISNHFFLTSHHS